MYSGWNSEINENFKTSKLLKDDLNKDGQFNQDIFNILGMDRWLEGFGEGNAFGDILYKSFLLKKSHQKEGLFLPYFGYQWEFGEEVYRTSFKAMRFLGAQKNADHLKNSLVDDSLPYEDRSFNYHFSPSGRIQSARLLGDIRYNESIDNLIEAGVHDDNEFMRAECFGSLDRIKEGTFQKATILSERLLLEEKNWVKMEVAKALGSTGNPIVIGVMREQIEDMLPHISYYKYLDSSESWNEEKDEYPMAFIWMFQNLLVGIFKLDDHIGREVLKYIIDYDDDTAIHYAYLGLFLGGVNISKNKKIIIPSISEIRKYG